MSELAPPAGTAACRLLPPPPQPPFSSANLACISVFRRRSGEQPPVDPASVHAAQLPVPGGALVAVSPDESLAAVASDTTLQLFSTAQLASTKGSADDTNPLVSVQLPAPARQFAWRPNPAAAAATAAAGGGNDPAPGYAVLLADGSVLLDSCVTAEAAAAGPAPLAALAGDAVSGIGWSPDGAQLAAAVGADVSILAVGAAASGGSKLCSLQVLSSDAEEGTVLQVRGHWGADASLLSKFRW